MASMSTVSVLCLNGRRQAVKVNRNTSILTILEEVCKKQGYEVSEYDLKHHNKVLSPSDTFGYSGIPNNGLLEIFKREQSRTQSTVIVALQLENGERVTKSYPSNDTLWHIVTDCKAIQEVMPEVQPVCVYMRTEVAGESNLSNTTLQSLGLIGGKAVIRFLQRTKAVLKDQAHREAMTFPKRQEKEIVNHMMEEGPASNPIDISSPECIEDMKDEPEEMNVCSTTIPQPFKGETRTELESLGGMGKPSECIAKDMALSEKKELGSITSSTSLNCKIHVLDESGSFIFNMNELSLSFDDVPDSFYEHTLDDIKYLMHDLKRKRQDMEQALLLTRSMRNTSEQRKKPDYKRSVLRVMFPDRLVIQSVFQPEDTIANVMECLMKYVDHADFYLYLTPPKSVLCKEISLKEANLVPSALLHFGSIDQRGQYVRQEIIDKLEASEIYIKPPEPKAKDTVVAATPSNSNQHELPLPTVLTKSRSYLKKDLSQDDSVPSTSGGSSSSTDKVPKWFKFGAHQGK